MGDRGNIVMRYTDSIGKRTDVYFYSHWNGSDLPRVLQGALARKVRWNNEAYLSRIIFNAMTRGNEEAETGFGISLGLCDNEHDILIVDHKAQRVFRQTEEGGIVAWWPFEDFIKLDLSDVFANY